MLIDRPLNSNTPGVYFQQSAIPASQELYTGVPAFLGLAEVKQTTQPQMLTLWTQFEQIFGKASPDSYLAHAVRGFFENGGRLCYVLGLRENTFAELQQGLAAIEVLDSIDLVCAPDVMQKSEEEAILMQKAILEHCDHLGDRMAILDALNVSDPAKIQAQKQRLQGNNGALYAPWIKIENFDRDLPPCGHIAGIYARSDREIGIHRAPANFILEGVLDLSANFSNTQLQTAGINSIVSLRNRGIRLWGALTLSQFPQWQYINVRRLFLTVTRWAERNLTNLVFEPNDLMLWIRIQRELTVYCESLWRKGALSGNTVQEAFYVKCDAETNPPEIRNEGKVVTEIGLAPTLPSEFIVVSLIHGNSGVTIAK